MTVVVDLRQRGELFRYAAALVRAQGERLRKGEPTTVVARIAPKQRHLRLVCVVCGDQGCPHCPKVDA